MKTLFLSASVLALAIGSAAAADLPVKAPVYSSAPVAIPFTWAGWYVGANLGYADSYTQDTIDPADKISGFIVGTGAVPGTVNDKAGGWLGGATVGYNWVVPFNASVLGSKSAVLGIEADFDWSGLSGSDSQTLTLAPFKIPASLATSAARSDQWLSTIRGRIGFTPFDPQTLIYATGGLALADVNDSTSIALATPIKALNATWATSDSGTKLGWTVGAGIESALTPHWTWKAEYLFVDLGSESGTMAATIAKTPITFTAGQDLNEHIVRAGLNYKF
jgi:outer membrane immunogenic protein